MSKSIYKDSKDRNINKNDLSLKERSSLHNLSGLFRENKDEEYILEKACLIITNFFKHKDYVNTRIKYGKHKFCHDPKNFVLTEWKLERSFQTIYQNKGSVEVYYTKAFSTADKGPFTNVEISFLKKATTLITSYINTLEAGQEIDGRISGQNNFEPYQKERLKELACISSIENIIKAKKSIDITLQEICYEIRKTMQYSEYIVVRILFNDKVYSAPKEFADTTVFYTVWTLREAFNTDNGNGVIVVYLLKETSEKNSSPFSPEEKSIIKKIAGIFKNYINDYKSPFDILKTKSDINDRESTSKFILSEKKKFVRNFLHKNNFARDIFHDLMPFKVKEILLFANLYDAFSIEKEGRISDNILGEYYQLNLTSVPRITAVSTFEETHEQLNQKYFDLIIIMSGSDKQIPIELSSSIYNKFGYIPTYLLANNNTDMSFYQEPKNELKFIDKVFVWNGDSRIFFTITKLLEDKVNVENDTKIGYARVILLVEDSAKYYSRYLPLLYTSVLNQTKRIIDDVSKMDELFKILRLRARPKVMLATTYEQAIDILEKYKDNMLCLISDVKFTKEGELTKDAGFRLVEHVKKQIPDLPTVIQSSNIKNEERAIELETRFIYKNTETLLQEIRNFISVNLGFGNFIFKDIYGTKYEVAKNLSEFKEKLKLIPEQSIRYHAGKNHFSLWFTARGEIQIAKLLAPLKVNDFESIEQLRKHLIDVIDDLTNERTKGKIVGFRENSVWDESSIAILSSGALGGKGRGLAFVNSLLYSFDLSEFIPKINLRTPRTAIIGIDEFESFIEENELSESIYEVKDYQLIKKQFLNAHLSDRLIEKMKMLLEQTNKPLAVRSSGLFEDSLMQPFAGVFSTYILPNSHEDMHIRLKQACEAIKLVFASVFSKTSRDYINAINYKIEEERMAVVIQELVGNVYDQVYYPQISGTAQSYNYYPFGHMEPEDGYAVSAIGLGTYVVSGEKSYRFCPNFPTLVNNSPKDQFRNSQVEFFAVNLANKNIDLLQGEDAGLIRLDIDEAEMHGNLNHCASVYDPENNIISPGIDKYGPRIINFANILKYNYIPLAETIRSVLDIVKEALGSPVEIEFAVDLNKDKDGKATFYLLQIKPLIGNVNDFNINMDEVNKDALILYTENGMGNGQIDDISDVIYVDKNTFDKSKTKEIALEIENLNNKMIKANKNYILIGPGRWGTRDPWIGIPVNWTQISKAKIIVETSLQDFPLDASAGSHFFHNVTSMNVGYFSIQHHSTKCMINWDIFADQKLIDQGKYIKHIRFKKPLTVKMDGKQRISLISLDK
ncbi:MAG: DUF5752 family protein [Bacteroidota bacterium]